MQLSIKDRIIIPSVFPKTGKFEDLILTEEILKKIKFSLDEIKAHNIHSNQSAGVEWNEEGYIPLECDFSELEKVLIKKCLVEMNAQEKLTSDHLDIYRKFVL